MPDMAWNKARPMPDWMQPGVETCDRGYARAAWTAQPAWLDPTTIRDVYRAARRAGVTVDHIVPLRHPDVCGLHVPWNLRLLGACENFSLGNRTWPDMWHEQATLDLQHPAPVQLRLVA